MFSLPVSLLRKSWTDLKIRCKSDPWFMVLLFIYWLTAYPTDGLGQWQRWGWFVWKRGVSYDSSGREEEGRSVDKRLPYTSQCCFPSVCLSVYACVYICVFSYLWFLLFLCCSFLPGFLGIFTDISAALKISSSSFCIVQWNFSNGNDYGNGNNWPDVNWNGNGNDANNDIRGSFHK